MNDRKALIDEYKNRKKIGGVYKITNTRTGSYFLDCATDLAAKQNSFNFMVSSGTCFHHRLKHDWDTFGPAVFVFGMVEELEMKEGQTAAGFQEDLQVLKQIWVEKSDPLLSYG